MAKPAMVVDIHTGSGCRWHPPSLWLGLGCERNTSLGLLERLVDQTLAAQQLAPQAVAGLASIDRKADEPALLQLAQQRGWPLRCFDAASLAAVALNWCRAHGALPIPGLRKPAQAEAAAAALAWQLTPVERQELDRLAFASEARMPANPFQSA